MIRSISFLFLNGFPLLFRGSIFFALQIACNAEEGRPHFICLSLQAVTQNSPIRSTHCNVQSLLLSVQGNPPTHLQCLERECLQVLLLVRVCGWGERQQRGLQVHSCSISVVVWRIWKHNLLHSQQPQETAEMHTIHCQFMCTRKPAPVDMLVRQVFKKCIDTSVTPLPGACRLCCLTTKPS